jgi:hypothetical protein
MSEPLRSPLWRACAEAHLKKQPHCLCCGRETKEKLNVHHKFPFHYVVACGRPDLELDERNLFTLCVEHDEEHHLLVGHLDSFESYNPDLEKMLALCRGLTAAQIRALPEWKRAVEFRPKPLSKMTGQEKGAFHRMLDRELPEVKP